MSAVVRKALFAEIKNDPAFPALAHEYAEECAVAGLPAPDEKLAAYSALGQSPFFQPFGAYADGSLVGFMAVLVPVIPHYGVTIAVGESYFVAKGQRKSGAGLRLLDAAEAHAVAAGAPGLFVSAPVGGPLAEVLPRRGYRETNRVFFKEMRRE